MQPCANRTRSAGLIASVLAATLTGQVSAQTQGTYSCFEGRGSIGVSYLTMLPQPCWPTDVWVEVRPGSVTLHATQALTACAPTSTPYWISGSSGPVCDGWYSTMTILHRPNGTAFAWHPGPTVELRCRRADFNGDCAVSVQDIFDFLGAYFAGCN